MPFTTQVIFVVYEEGYNCTDCHDGSCNDPEPEHYFIIKLPWHRIEWHTDIQVQKNPGKEVSERTGCLGEEGSSRIK